MKRVLHLIGGPMTGFYGGETNAGYAASRASRVSAVRDREAL